MSDEPWPQDRLRNLIDGLDNVRTVLQNSLVARFGRNVELAPEDVEELIPFVVDAGDFLRDLELLIREAKP